MSREAMQLALEALEKVITAFGSGLTLQQNAITALRQALETEQEPVAWMHNFITGNVITHIPADIGRHPERWAPLYTSPQKQWVGLTDEEIQDLGYLSQKIDEGNSPWFDRLGFAKAIEQALKKKNKW